MNKALSLFGIVLFATFSAKADLITITAAGNINNVYNSSISNGTYVEYTFQFDTEQNGSYSYGTTTHTLNDNYDYGLNYFYADFLGNNVLRDYNISVGPSEYNYGYKYESGYQSLLAGGTGSHYINIYGRSDIDDWQVGTSLYGYETSYISASNWNFSYEQVTSILTITSLSNVPEPSVVATMLSGIGLLCISAFGTLRKRVNNR